MWSWDVAGIRAAQSMTLAMLNDAKSPLSDIRSAISNTRVSTPFAIAPAIAFRSASGAGEDRSESANNARRALRASSIISASGVARMSFEYR